MRRFLVMLALPLVLFACNNGNEHEDKLAVDEQKQQRLRSVIQLHKERPRSARVWQQFRRMPIRRSSRMPK